MIGQERPNFIEGHAGFQCPVHGFAAERECLDGATRPRRLSRLQNLLARLGAPGKSPIGLPTACAAMGALVLALMIWRVDVVRLLPQTTVSTRWSASR